MEMLCNTNLRHGVKMRNGKTAIFAMVKKAGFALVLLAIVGGIAERDLMLLWITGCMMLLCSLYIIVMNWVMLLSSLTTHRFHSAVPLIGSTSGVIGLLLIPVSMPHYSIYFLPVLIDCGTIMLFFALPLLIKDLFFTPRTLGLKEELLRFMWKKGLAIRKVDGGFFDCPDKSKKLIVNFLPPDETFSHGIKAIEENVKMIVCFLVRRKLTRNVNWLQIAVNVESDGVCHVLVKYLFDETKIRELEKHRSLFSQSIMKMRFGDIISKDKWVSRMGL